MTLRDLPAYRLTRHFFAGFFDLGFLSDAGTLSYTRLIIGICATFLSAGLLLLRVFMKKYMILAEQPGPEPYRLAVVADHTFLLALPMWIVAFATVLVGHAIFPDEHDFRILMSLPITRRLVFGAKLAALALFTCLFIVSAQIALFPLALVTTLSRWAEGAFLARIASYGVATLVASGFAMLSITAIHGLLLVVVARHRALSISAMLRSLMLCALVLTLPLVGRLPAQTSGLADGAFWIYFSPPAWFLGIERWLAGDTRAHIVRLAEVALVAVVIAGAVAAGSYAFLYRHFDRVMLRSAQQVARHKAQTWRSERLSLLPSALTLSARAVQSFIFLTLRRSVFHQGIVVVVAAFGAGLVLNSFLSSGVVDWLMGQGGARRAVIQSIIWAPFALVYIFSRGVRAALLIPIEPRANWIFRMTERDDLRLDQLEAAARAVGLLGVVCPIALLFPLQWLLLGPTSLLVLAVSLVCGWLYVELLMKNWGRIPFTCSYIPGKRFVPHAIFIGLTLFLGFTIAGSGLARVAMSSGSATFVVIAILLALSVALRWRRLNNARSIPLEFEDALPTEVNPLRLGAD